MLVWEKYDGPRKWPQEHAIQSNILSPFQSRNRIIDFCNTHFGEHFKRWRFVTEAREFDNGRVRNSRFILCFETEADMVFFLTGCER